MAPRTTELTTLLVVATAKEAVDLARELRQRGFVAAAADGVETASNQLKERRWDIVVLDGAAFPPKEPATQELVSLARERHASVVALLTALLDDPAADAAFDDFALRPVSVPELVARLQRLARRHGAHMGNQAIRIGDLVIDPERYEVRLDEHPVDLTYREYQLLLFLATHPERVYSREALLDQVWGYDYFGGTRTVDVHVRRLRSKLEDANHQFIETLRNVGYRFREGSGGEKKGPPD